MTDQTEQKQGYGSELKIEHEIVIETGKLFTLKTPDGLITETGMAELQAYLYEIGVGKLPDDFEPVWTTKRGTLPKRISAYSYKTNKIKVSPEQVSAIGNIARRHTSLAETYILDFTRSFDWSAGDFGDSGSCFWGSNSGAKLMLEANGAYAIRAYKRTSGSLDGLPDYNHVTGYARAWLIKLPDNKLVLFNGYGLTSLDFARILSLKFSCSYKKINVTNNGSQSGMLYINSGSYLIGPWSKIEAVTSHDFRFDDIESEPEYYCAVCDCELGEDYMTSALNRCGDRVNCCEECSAYCERCEESYISRLVSELDGEWYCVQCREQVLEERAEQAEQEAQAEQAELWEAQERLEALERSARTLESEVVQND